jgi:propanediol dehydratase small subunit
VNTVKTDFLGLGKTISTTFEITAPKRDAGTGATPTASGLPTLPGDETGKLSKTQEALKKLREEFNLATAQFAVFGDSFDVVGTKSKALESTINSLLANGIKPQSSLIKGLKAQFDALNNVSLDKLSNTFEIAAEAIAESAFKIAQAFKAIPVALQEASAAFSEAYNKDVALAQMAADQTAAIAGFVHAAVSDSLAGMGEVIGQALAGVSLSAGSIASSILAPFADMAVQLGKYAISMGVGVEAIKASFVSFSGLGAIAAGVALVALGTAAKSALSGMGKKGGSAPSISGGGYQAPRPSDSASSSKRGPDTLRTKISGRDLLLILEQESAFTKRFGG